MTHSILTLLARSIDATLASAILAMTYLRERDPRLSHEHSGRTRPLIDRRYRIRVRYHDLIVIIFSSALDSRDKSVAAAFRAISCE